MKKLPNFPQFTVTKIQKNNNTFEVSGIFNHTKNLLESRYWLINNDECPIGDLFNFKENEKIGAFTIFGEDGDIEKIQTSKTYACLSISWNWNLYRAILDPTTVWHKDTFKPSDAQVFYLPNGVRGWCKFGQAINHKDAKIGEVIKDGWDHEECEICYSHIGRGGNSEYYKYDWHWLCIDCFNKYASKHDLSFTDGIEPT